MGFYLKMNVWYYFVDPRLASKSKFLSKVKNKMVARYFKVKYDFQQMKLGANVIPHFHVILTGQFISCIICMIQGHLQGQKVKYQGPLSKTTVLNK